MASRRLAQLICIGLLLSLSQWSAADEALNLSVVVPSSAKLSVTTAQLTFADANPDSTPKIRAIEAPITLTVKIRKAPGSAPAILSVVGTDLLSGSNQISANRLSWTASGAGFASGTLSQTLPVQLGVFQTSGTFLGTLNFDFENRWDYVSGAYAGSLLLTLVSP